MKKTIIIQIVAIMIMISLSSLSIRGDNAMKKTATFAGGCFWCMEGPFEQHEGVSDVVSGYIGGSTLNPSYEEVSSGRTGHIEAIQVTYDPSKVSYEELLEIFWHQIDPTDEGGQFNDRGSQYVTAVFYHDDEQKNAAEKSKKNLAKSEMFTKPIKTTIRPAVGFYEAEAYHQNYYKTNAFHYNMYKKGSGREAFLKKTWEKTRKDNLKKKLNSLQYKVTQECATENPFNNEYWDNKKDGIYVDIVSGEALFSSKDKFDSGTGWPSFTKPLKEENIVEKEDKKLFMKRTEVRSKEGDSHLGHVFDDGPKPTGQRYCMNSAALRFVPVENLEKEGYSEYLSIFEKVDSSE